MRARWPVAGVLVAAAAAGSALAELGPAPSPSRVVYPVQELPLSFDHAQHLELDGVTCARCHADAETSLAATDRLIPGESACTSCHLVDRAQPGKAALAGQPDAKCVSCHPGWDAVGAPPRVVIPTPNLKFNHRVHAEREIACDVCHGDLAKDGVGLATRDHLPRMATCLACHDGKTAGAKCASCHPSGPGGRLRTSFAEGKLVPSGALRGDAHDLAFTTSHAEPGRDATYCESCHKKSECLDCHDGAVKPAIHAGDYVALHGVDARRNSPDCTGCHRQQTFCTGCHTRLGVSMEPKTGEHVPASVRAPQTPLRAAFHPGGWDTGHARDAKKNLRACASCHREEDCVACHDTRGGENPHGPGWAGSARCESLLARNARVCTRCHTSREELSCE